MWAKCENCIYDKTPYHCQFKNATYKREKQHENKYHNAHRKLLLEDPVHKSGSNYDNILVNK